MPRDLFQELFGYLGAAAGDVVERVLEGYECVDCGEPAIPVRCVCGNYACHEHGFFNIHGACICPMCAQRLAEEGGHLDNDGRPRGGSRRSGRSQQQQQQRSQAPQQPRVKPPWELLGLDRNATEGDVNRAFRQMALDCHPDLHPSDTTLKKRFQALQRAKDACLADVRARSGEES